MSFTRRKINVRIVLGDDHFNGTNNILELSGLRCQATILSCTGGTTPAVSQLQLRIYGMQGADMAKLSTMGFSSGTYIRNLIEVSAGDDEAGMSVVFSGGIASSLVDYNAMPNVGVDILAYAGYFEKLQSVAGSSFRGAASAADMLQAIGSRAGFTVVTNGVTAQLMNHSSPGTTMDQITDICRAARVQWFLQGKALYIWPEGGQRDNSIIDMSAQSGMVGYPMYTGHGVDVTSLFNPETQVGRRMLVTTSIPNLNPEVQRKLAIKSNPQNVPKNEPVIPGDKGTYYIGVVTHDLESETANGKWFTLANLSLWKDVARSVSGE